MRSRDFPGSQQRLFGCGGPHLRDQLLQPPSLPDLPEEVWEIETASLEHQEYPDPLVISVIHPLHSGRGREAAAEGTHSRFEVVRPTNALMEKVD